MTLILWKRVTSGRSFELSVYLYSAPFWRVLEGAVWKFLWELCIRVSVCACVSPCVCAHLFHHNHKKPPPHSFPGLCRLAHPPIATLPGLALQLLLDQQTSGYSCLHPTPVLRLATLGVLLSPPPLPHG